jgi:prepilin peptidase CpaA
MGVIWVIVVFVSVAAWYDVKSRIVPDWIPGLIMLCAVAQIFVSTEPYVARVIVEATLGAVLGLAIGLILFQYCGFGGGDAKLIAALGAFLGPSQLLATCVCIAIAGALAAMLAQSRGKRDFAYVPAIAVGVACHGLLAGHLWTVLNS